MSTLLKALRRADQPQFTPHMPLMGLPVSQEEEPNRRWIWRSSAKVRQVPITLQ